MGDAETAVYRLNSFRYHFPLLFLLLLLLLLSLTLLLLLIPLFFIFIFIFVLPAHSCDFLYLRSAKAKLAEEEGARYRKDTEASRRNEESARVQAMAAKGLQESETRVADEARRRATELQEEESCLRESVVKFKGVVATLKKSMETIQSELDGSRLACEKERRALADLRATSELMKIMLIRVEMAENQWYYDVDVVDK